MLERLIIDISKWIAFIVLFFMAFGCSLYFLYAPYSAILETHEASIGISSSVVNSTDPNFAQCPDLFFALMNQTNVPSIDDNSDTSNDDTTSTNDTCQDDPSYSDLQRIGPYPAIFYFGQSFRATVLTAFFTLFGNIATGGVPVTRLTISS